MKKTISNQNGQGQRAQGPQIDITKTVPLICDDVECGNDMFLSAMKFRKVPKLLAGTQADQIIPVQVFFCTKCGAVPKALDLNV